MAEGWEMVEDWEVVEQVRIILPTTISEFLQSINDETKQPLPCKFRHIQTNNEFVIAIPIALETDEGGVWIKVKWSEVVYHNIRKKLTCWVRMGTPGEGVEENAGWF